MISLSRFIFVEHTNGSKMVVEKRFIARVQVGENIDTVMGKLPAIFAFIEP
jgi:hypothetical protein